MIVHHIGDLEPDALALLSKFLDARIRLTSGPDLPEAADFQVLVAGRPERRQLLASPDFRLLVIPWAGLPPETRSLLLDYPHIAVHNLHHNAALTSELAIALLLSAAKLIIPYDRALACHALGMRVLAVKRSAGTLPELDYPAEIHPPAALHNLLPLAQAVLVALPNTPHTEGLLGETELRLMPPGGLLVNIARGPVVDQGALYRALHDGHLHAAGLDVWYHYPATPEARSNTPPADFPFHELDNLVLSPHRAGLAVETEALRMQALAELLNAACRGERIPNRVDVAAGY